jgi:hypothetical protein
MLDSTNTTILTTQPHPLITGRWLAHNRLNARDRARLAADIIARRKRIDGASLTAKQIIKLCRANKAYVNEARFPERVRQNRRNKLAKAFNQIEFESRVELCRTIGAERVWNALAAAID